MSKHAPKHFLGLEDIPASELRAILDEAHARKKARAGFSKGALDSDAPCTGKTLAMIFEKSSTRTRFSFDMGMRQLGGSSITATSNDLQLGRGETIEDTAKVLSRFVDGIMLRANSHETLVALAHNSEVPVINGLTDLNHPCQILADLQTLEEQGRTLKGLTLAWVGDGNNVALSFVHAAAKFGFSLRVATPKGYDLRGQELERARAAGADIITTRSAAEAAAGADVLIADTFVSMGDKDADLRLKDLAPYEVTETLMKAADKEALFLHCLPAHRGEEVAASVIDGPQSVVFDEAENRLHAQKAILKWCFEG